MALGSNTSLAYIISCLQSGYDLYLYYVISQEKLSLDLQRQSLSLVFLAPNDPIAQKLISTYKQKNEEIKNFISDKSSRLLLGEAIDCGSLQKSSIDFKNIDLIIQRIEPMKSPFPPHGSAKINEVLGLLMEKFPDRLFQAPINLGDKAIIEEIDLITKNLDGGTISIPTSRFLLNSNLDFVFVKKYKKLVIKPENSAQSLGVFSVQFLENGASLPELQSKNISDLLDQQIYKIKTENLDQDLIEILNIACFIEAVKANGEILQQEDYSKPIKSISKHSIIELAKTLYNDKILIQPFIEGVKQGDIRVNIIKNIDGNFMVSGATFRKNISASKQHFTTCYSASMSEAKPISTLPKKVLLDLEEKIIKLVNILNNQLKAKYSKIVELGVDFICDFEEGVALLNEINHYCPALMPVSEAMEDLTLIFEKNEAFLKIKYDGGLGAANLVLEAQKIVR